MESEQAASEPKTNMTFEVTQLWIVNSPPLQELQNYVLSKETEDTSTTVRYIFGNNTVQFVIYCADFKYVIF